MAGLVLRRGSDLDQEVEQGFQVRAGLGQVERGGAGLGVGVDDREVDLVRIGPKVDEQLVDVVQDLRRTRVGAVDLVQRHDHRQVALHGLLQHVPRLGQRTLRGVHQQQHGIHHEEAALHLAAEVGVAGGVDDVQPHAAVIHGRLLGQDGDALLALQVAGVQHAVNQRLVRAEGARLAQQPIDQRGLAVVDVRDDRQVAQVAAHGEIGGPKAGHGPPMLAEGA